MSIIIISSNSEEAKKEIAEAIVETNKYNLLNDQILKEIEITHNINTGKLSEALEKTPSLFKKVLSQKWQYYLACIEAEVLNRLQNDNIVCYGLAAHLYVQGVSHALKIRIIHNNNQRIEKIAEQQGIPMQRARKWLEAESRKRKKWSIAAYNLDETDSSQYDLVINLNQIDLGEAIKTITGAVGYRKFQPITYSIKCLSDLALAAKVRTVLLKSMNDIRIQARDSTVIVFTKALKQRKQEKIMTIKNLAGNIEGVGCVEVHVTKNLFNGADGNY
jgi:cytidylate kinase